MGSASGTRTKSEIPRQCHPAGLGRVRPLSTASPFDSNLSLGGHFPRPIWEGDDLVQCFVLGVVLEKSLPAIRVVVKDNEVATVARQNGDPFRLGVERPQRLPQGTSDGRVLLEFPLQYLCGDAVEGTGMAFDFRRAEVL